ARGANGDEAGRADEEGAGLRQGRGRRRRGGGGRGGQLTPSLTFVARRAAEASPQGRGGPVGEARSRPPLGSKQPPSPAPAGAESKSPPAGPSGEAPPPAGQVRVRAARQEDATASDTAFPSSSARSSQRIGPASSWLDGAGGARSGSIAGMGASMTSGATSSSSSAS